VPHVDPYPLLRSLFFRFDAEAVHHLALRAMRMPGTGWLWNHFGRGCDQPLSLWGLLFRNRIGLAAGFDKNAEILPASRALGFGFTEVGTVTRHAQPGNPVPRIFRRPEQQALINRMGFPNSGAEAMAAHLARCPRVPDFPIGINIGKSKVTPLPQAPEDYLHSFRTLYEAGDYFVVNVSSPNTPGLRDLQTPEALRAILTPLAEDNRFRANKPLLVKIAPDLHLRDIDHILELAIGLKLHGIVATNTTIDQSSLSPARRETGGLSGAPLRQRSTEIIRHIHQRTMGRLPIIGAGGVITREDYLEKLEAGASLVQIYTGFIYQGPSLVRQLLGVG
jgi:dihydroorotate dehydrogenase